MSGLKEIKNAIISVFNKNDLQPVVEKIQAGGTKIYSTGGTQQFIEGLGVKVNAVEGLTSFPSILGGRVKTLHPLIFGGILGRRENESDLKEMAQFSIPEIDLVIVDLYPFEDTVKATTDESTIIEKIDIGGVSLIRAAAKNYKDVVVIASQQEYTTLTKLLNEQGGKISLEQRKTFAAKAFEICAHYDVAIAKYFNPSESSVFLESVKNPVHLRYGENPHQSAVFYGELDHAFTQLNGKELSYNNLTDVDAACELIREFTDTTFAIIKHTNVCGVASRNTVKEAWDEALAGDPESAFGGVLICNATIDKATAAAVDEIFFEVLIAPAFEPGALEVLKSKKNRILLQQKEKNFNHLQYKSLLNGVLVQQNDAANFQKWDEVGGRETTPKEREDLKFANLVCKHLKSNAIALVKNKQLIGKGCGQTSRIDALRQAINKAKQFEFDIKGAAMASDAFFPFSDCVEIAYKEGIGSVIQPGGSIRDKDSIEFCTKNKLPMVITGTRHFKH